MNPLKFEKKNHQPLPVMADLIGEPLKCSLNDRPAWEETADIVIVGFGGAGAVAAIEAADSGADVIAIDRFKGGGATALSGGIVYAGGTPYQKQAGYSDTAEEMFKYLSLESGSAVSEKTLRAFCDQSAGNLQWLEKNNLQFEGSLYSGKTSYPPNDKYLYFSGNEKMSGYRQKAAPAPRGHRVLGKGWTGYMYYEGLKKSAIDKGVRIRPFSRAVRLVTDEERCVIGVEVLVMPDNEKITRLVTRLYEKVSPFKPFNGKKAEKAIAQCRALEARYGRRVFLKARKGVILATGGFVSNIDLMQHFSPIHGKYYQSLLKMGSMGCDGSGIALGESVGGACHHMESLFAAKNIAPPDALIKGIVVNKEGKRFISEESYAGFLGNKISCQPDGKAWLVVDGSQMRKALYQALSACWTSGWDSFKNYSIPFFLNFLFGGTRRGRSIKALAEKTQIDPNQLAISLDQYNQSQLNTEPDPFDKQDEYRALLNKQHLWAINLSVDNPFGFTIVLTLGGLRVNEETGQVLGPEGEKINGLYAAGAAAVRVCSEGYFSGLSLADNVFSGRRASRHCLKG